VGQIKSPDVEITGEDTSNASKALASIGVNVLDKQTHQLRDMDSILGDVAKKWNTLSADQKAYVSFNAAATRQYSMFEAIMQGYSKSTELATQSLNANGYALKQQTTYMESNEAKIKSLESSMTSMWQNAISSNFINEVISGLNVLVNTFGNLPGIILTIVTALSLWKGTQLTTWLTSSRLATDGWRASLIANRGALIGMTEAEITTATATKGLTLTFEALKVALATNPIGFVATALLTLWSVFDIGKSAIDGYTAKQKQAFDDLNNSINTLKSETSELPDLISSYEKLSAQTLLTASDKQKLADVTQKLADLFPSAVSGYDTEGKAAQLDSLRLQQLIKEKQELLKIQQQSLAASFQSSGESDLKKLEKNQQMMATLQKDIADTQKNIDNTNPNSIFMGGLQKHLADLKSQMNSLLPTIQSETNALATGANTFDQASGSVNHLTESITHDLIDAVSSGKMSMADLISTMNLLKDNNISKTIEDVTTRINEMSKEGKSATEIQKYIADSLKAFQNGLGDIGNKTPIVTALIAALNKEFALPNVVEAKKELTSVEQALNNVDSATQTYLKSMEDLASASAKMAEGHKLTVTEIQKLIKVHPELADNISHENGLLVLNKKAVDDLMAAKDADYKNDLKSQKAVLIAQQNKINGILSAANIEIKSIKDVDNARRTAFENYQNMVSAQGMGSQDSGIYHMMKEQTDNAIGQWKEIQDGITSIDLSSQITPQDLVNSSSPDLNKKSKHSPSTPLSEFTNIEDSIVRSYNSQVKQTEIQNKLLEKQIATAKSAKDYNTELDLSNQLLKGQEKELTQLGEAKSKIQQEFSRVSSNSGFANTSTWFDPTSGEDTLAYQTAFQNASVETRKTMKETHDQLQTLYKAFLDNATAVDTLNTSIDKTKSSLSQISIDKFNDSMTNFDNSLSQSKAIMDLYSPTSEKYIKEQQNQINILKDKQKVIDDTIAKEKELLAGNTLTPEAREIVTDDLTKQQLASSQNKKAIEVNDPQLTTIKNVYEIQQKQNDALQKSLSLQLQIQDSISPKNYDAINVILGSQISLEQTNISKIQESITALTAYRNTLDQSSEKWKEVNDEISTMNSNLEQSLSTLSQTYKTQEQNSMNQQLSSIEKTIFGGQTEEQAKQALQNKVDYNNQYISGAEKAAAVLRIQNQLAQDNADLNKGQIGTQQTILQFTQDQLAILNSSGDIKRSDLDLLEKQLAIQKTQAELANASNEKSNRVLTQNPDGSYSWTWQADNTNILKLQGQLYQEQQDLAKTQIDDQNKENETLLNQKSEYFNNLKTVVEKALNGEYTTASDFNNAMLTANSGFLNSMQGSNTVIWTSINSTVTSNINSMLSAYQNYVNQMQALQAQLMAIMGAAATMPSSVSNSSGSSSSGIGSILGTSTGPDGSHLTTVKTATGTQTVLAGTNGTPAWANGTEDSPEGFQITSEKGAELTYLNKGSAVIPANFTKNIMAFGGNPLGYIQNLISQVNIPKIPSFTSLLNNASRGSTDNSITIEHMDVHSSNADNFVAQLNNLRFMPVPQFK
jgi:hypothetical protein